MRMLKTVCAFFALVAASGAVTCTPPQGERNDLAQSADAADAGAQRVRQSEIEEVENGLGSMSVMTPKGKFECINSKDTGYRQVLHLAGRVIHEEVPGPDGIREDSTLHHGIEDRSTGCPWVVAVYRGLVVIGRDVQPPFYGVQGYAVIDFNRAEPSLTRLASGQRPGDDDISSARRIEWSEGSLVLSVFGYAPDDECCTVGSPKPRPLRVRYMYENGRVEVVKG